MSVCHLLCVIQPSLSPHAPPSPSLYPHPFSWGTSLQICTHLHIFHPVTDILLKTEPSCTLKTTVSFVSKQLWISGGADSCQHLFDKQNSYRWITEMTQGDTILYRHTISPFFQANTKPNLVFHLLLGTILHLLKLMNSGKMNSNCRLFFIFLKPF